MSDCDLCSAVVILRPERVFPAEQRFLGRMAQRLFLLMLGQVGAADIAAALHSANERHPFTVSDLFQNGPQHYWMRVTGLTPALCQTLQHMAGALPGQVLDIPPRDSADESPWRARVETVVTAQHEWAAQSTYAALVDHAWQGPRARPLQLDFITPTVVKSVGVYRVFPEPALVFRLLYERLLKLEAFSLPFQPEITHLEHFAEYFVEVRDHEIACARVPLKRGQVTAFYGPVAYEVLANNEDFVRRAHTRESKHGDAGLSAIAADIQRNRQAYGRLVHLLADFAFYSGLGSFTAQGMGMVRRGRH